MVTAIGHKAAYFEGYAGIDTDNSNHDASVTAMTETGTPTGWGDPGNLTLSWDTSADPSVLECTIARSENYVLATFDVEYVSHDGNITVNLLPDGANFA